MNQRDSFTSKFGIIAAAAGSAIGLGNIWKFPYIAGENGGAAFIVVYLICIFLIGFPVMLSEFTIGRKAQKNAVGAFKTLSPGRPWFMTGIAGVLAAFLILSFYGVVGGWTIAYIFKSIAGSFNGLDPDAIGGLFIGFITDTVSPIIWQVIFMILTALIVICGVKNGIERSAKLMMPILLAIIIILDIRALTLPGAGAGVEFLLKPDWSKLTGASILVALGHAFFSLSLGMGTMITYGSYIPKKEDLSSTAFKVTLADTIIALLAGFAIFPAVFAFGIEPSMGAGLAFVTLPNIFQQMAGGMIFQIMFFVLLAFAALTSAISLLEVPVAYFVEEKGMKRPGATILTTIIITVLGMACSLSNGVFSTAFIKGKNFFDSVDYIASNILLPLGGLFIAIYVGWFMGIDRVKAEITNEGSISVKILPVFIWLARFVAPVLILYVFYKGL